MNCKVLNIDCENEKCKKIGVNRKTNLRITPNTFLTNYLYDKVPDMKGKRHKIQMDDFIILEYHEYDLLIQNLRKGSTNVRYNHISVLKMLLPLESELLTHP